MNNMCALMERHNPTILALTETRMEDHNKILQALDYADVIQVPATGYSGGIALFWRTTEVTIEPFILTEQEIHAGVEVSSITSKWFLSIIYAKNIYRLRNVLWENLKNVSTKITGTRLVCGDFN